MPEDRMVIAFARYIRLGKLPEIVETPLVWMEAEKQEVPRKTNMEAALALTPSWMSRLPPNTHKPYMVQFPLAPIAPLYLVHPLLISPFLKTLRHKWSDIWEF